MIRLDLIFDWGEERLHPSGTIIEPSQTRSSLEARLILANYNNQ